MLLLQGSHLVGYLAGCLGEDGLILGIGVVGGGAADCALLGATGQCGIDGHLARLHEEGDATCLAKACEGVLQGRSILRKLMRECILASLHLGCGYCDLIAQLVGTGEAYFLDFGVVVGNGAVDDAGLLRAHSHAGCEGYN